MSDKSNPLGRQYTASEWAAAKRLDFTVGDSKRRRGPLIYATGPFYPEFARKMANDWKLVADAMEREFYSPKTRDALLERMKRWMESGDE